MKVSNDGCHTDTFVAADEWGHSPRRGNHPVTGNAHAEAIMANGGRRVEVR